MPQIALDLIDPNPFRNFELHPLDQIQVDRLKASISADGFWASVSARKVSGRYQLAFGHHRIEAARQLGKADAPIDVRDLSDWVMVRMLSTENAMQRGSTAAAALDAIAAVSKVISYHCWRSDAALIVKIFTVSLTAAERIWGNIRQNEGPGWRCILDLLPAGAFTTAQVQNALAVLKDSGRMDAIVATERARAEAEIALEEAKKPAGPAKNKLGSKPKVPAKATKPRAAPKFDANCAKLFKLDSHLAEFRRIVTQNTVLSFLPVDQQFKFAQAIIKKCGSGELTAIKLREQANILLYEGTGETRATLPKSKKRRVDHRITDGLNLLRRAVADAKGGTRILLSVLEDSPDALEHHAKFHEHLDALSYAVQQLRPDGKSHASHLRLVAQKGGQS